MTNLVHSLFQAYSASEVSRWLRETPWAFAWLTVCHLLAVVSLIGMMVILNLRALGARWLELPARDLSRELSKPVLVSLAGALLTGVLLTGMAPLKYYGNPFYRSKLSLLLLAWVLHLVLERWRRNAGTSALRERGLAALALGAWVGAVFSGRAIGLF